MAIRILIVDDHRVVREGLRMFLGCDPELVIVGEAADGIEAIEYARLLRPDVVLMDLFLTAVDGITATLIIRRNMPETKVVILTDMPQSPSMVEASRAGASGFLYKDAQASEMRTAIKIAAAGQAPHYHPTSISFIREVRSLEYPVPERLSVRESDVLRLLAQGHTNKEIARSLHIAEETVRTHVRHILAKFGVHRRTQAILTALRFGMIA